MAVLKTKDEKGNWIKLPYIIKVIQGGTVTTELSEEQIQAINEMIATVNEELTIEYDDEILDIDFVIEDNNLIVTNNVTGLDFNINENGEMEAVY
jgi:hypothetical protein